MVLHRFLHFRLSKTRKIREFHKISKKLTFWSLFDLQNGAFSSKMTPQDPPSSPQEPPGAILEPPGLVLGASGIDFGASGVDFGASRIDLGASGP